MEVPRWKYKMEVEDWTQKNSIKGESHTYKGVKQPQKFGDTKKKLYRCQFPPTYYKERESREHTEVNGYAQEKEEQKALESY